MEGECGERRGGKGVDEQKWKGGEGRVDELSGNHN